MKIIKRLLFFFSLFLLYLIAKEFVSFYTFMRSVHPMVGYLSLVVIGVFVTYFVIVPVLQIIRLPKSYSPTTSKDDAPKIMEKRMVKFRNNPFLIRSGFDFSQVSDDENGYMRIVNYLQPETERIKRRYVSKLFYSTSISQNGFLDAILILSSSVNLVKELFILYQGRVSNRDLLAIGKRVYYSMAIGGSEGVEYAADEIFSKFATGGIKSIPFADKILSSLADGFVNAALLTRIALITENYCKLVYIKSNRELYPSPGFIASTTKFLVSDITEKLFEELIRMSKEKTSNLFRLAAYPVNYILGMVMQKVIERNEKSESEKRSLLREVATVSNNQLTYGIHKVLNIFSRK